jgi:DNA topoisomerase-1
MELLEALQVVDALPEGATDDEHAAAVDLVLSDDSSPGISRVRRGRGFSFHLPDGTLLEGADRDRCVRLAVPPAWTDVWICPEAHGHLQATGRDDAGRKQYRYHDAWRALREATKFAALPRFGLALPTIRERYDSDLRHRTLDKDRVLSLVLALLDETLLRIGNEGYADENGGHGLTTIAAEHVDLGATVARFEFLGKSGVDQQVTLRDRRLVRQLRQIEQADQPQLLAWSDDGGETWRDVRAEDVNQHLREVAGEPSISAKDFRTWGGSVVALGDLHAAEPTDDERELQSQRIAAVDAAADALGNTRAVARSSYVHPVVLDAHGTAAIDDAYDDRDDVVGHLTPDERALLRLLGAGSGLRV